MESHVIFEFEPQASVWCYKGMRDDFQAACIFTSPSLDSQLARRLPARVQGYPWRLAYSTLEHGTSLKTLYRKSAALDSPVLLVIKDMDNQVRLVPLIEKHFFIEVSQAYSTGERLIQWTPISQTTQLAGFCHRHSVLFFPEALK